MAFYDDIKVPHYGVVIAGGIKDGVIASECWQLNIDEYGEQAIWQQIISLPSPHCNLASTIW
jgi:hypothetical protein